MKELSSFLEPLPTIPPPSRHHARCAVKFAKNRAPGYDGLPAEAWRAAGELSVDLAFESTLWLLSGAQMPPIWHSAVLVYPPKMVKADERRVSRKPKDTRPISLKLVAARHAMMTMYLSMRSAICAWNCASQCGFVPGRNLALVIIEADTWCRLIGLEAPYV